MLTQKAFGTTFLFLRSTILAKFSLQLFAGVFFFSKAMHLPWMVFPTFGVCVGCLELGLVVVGFCLFPCSRITDFLSVG